MFELPARPIPGIYLPLWRPVGPPCSGVGWGSTTPSFLRRRGYGRAILGPRMVRLFWIDRTRFGTYATVPSVDEHDLKLRPRRAFRTVCVPLAALNCNEK